MSGAAGSSQWMYASGFEIEQSLRLNNDDTAHLSRTPASAGNRRTFTTSVWFKLGNLTSVRLFTAQAAAGGTPFYTIDVFQDVATDNRGIRVNSSANSDELMLITDGRLRDTSAWYHLVAAVDTTQGTNSNRCKIYLNGVQLTDFATETYPSQNYETPCNNAIKHSVGAKGDGGNPFDGYMAEFNHIDGTALTPADFGETGDYGEWKPKKYSGTYGTNGFYLPFQQDYTVEGFSAVRSKGNATARYIGGIGFRPDLVFNGTRSASQNNFFFDSLRGANRVLRSNQTNAEANGDGVITFESDGFKRGQSNDSNENGITYVDWCWDMGGDSYGIPRTIEVGGNTKHSTTQKKIGDTSIRFDGNDDFLTIPDSTDWDSSLSADNHVITRDWTIEAWVRFDATGSSEQLFNRLDERVGSNHRSIYIKKDTDDTLVTRYGTGNAFSTSENKSTETLAANTWYHIAVVRQGNQFRTYLNGSRLASMDESHTTEIAGDTPFVIGAMYDSAWNDEFTGYMDEIRFSNKCRYSENFTAPTTAFTNDAHTTFLLHSDTTNNSTTFTDSAGAATNTDGSVTSYVAANPTYGQSIIKWTGNGTTGHGLSSAPEMIIVKPVDVVGAWWTWHKDLSNTSQGYLQLDTTAAEATNSSVWDNASPVTSTTINANTAYLNYATDNYIAYCFHSVTGYSKFGTYTGNGSSTGPTITTGFRPAFVMIKITSDTGGWEIWDSTRNPNNPRANTLQANLANAELTSSRNIDFTDTGFQIKNTTSNSNGNNETYIYMAFADTREYAYWLDQSGNNNDWTSNNLTESDISVDSPSNNFSTFNPLDKDTDVTLSQGNLETTSGTNANHSNVRSTFSMSSGKWYAEFIHTHALGGSQATAIGLATPEYTIQNTHPVSSSSGFWGLYQSVAAEVVTNGGQIFEPSVQTGIGDVIQIAFDADAQKFWLGVNNVWYNSSGGTTGNPATGANATASSVPSEMFLLADVVNNATQSVILNAGQDSSFAGNKTAQGNQDSNEIGDFFYEPPTNFLALCTKNLPEPAVTPSEHFSATVHAGNASNGHAITGVGFQPDFVWSKTRTGTYDWFMVDSVRGNTKYLRSNEPDDEDTYTDVLTSFDSDGYTLGAAGKMNESSHSHVAYNWKAGGSAVSASNLTGVGTATISANTDAGFSIVQWTSTQGGPVSYGHGLSQTPEFVITKSVTDDDYWSVGHESLGWDKAWNLNDRRTAVDSTAYWNDTSPTSTIVTLGGGVNNAKRFITYNFHSVEGYQGFGKYAGNQDDDGPFVYLGFRPAFLMIFSITTQDDGHLVLDAAREPLNRADLLLYVSNNDAEADNSGTATTTSRGIDFVSNGFKIRGANSLVNYSSREYAYWAIAETPFKYANAR